MPEQRVKGNAVPFGGVKRRQSLIWVLGRSVRRGSRARLPSEVLRIDTSYWVLPADKHMPFVNLLRQGENMILKKERNCYR